MNEYDSATRRIILVAEGDSWFEYLNRDLLNRAENVYADDLTDVVDQLSQIPNSGILAELSNYGYQIESAAHRGDTLASMANDDKQFAELAAVIERVSEKELPVAVILSAGGNDLIEKVSLSAEDGLSSKAILLDTLLRADGEGLDSSSVDFRLGEFSNDFHTLLTKITRKCEEHLDAPVPIFVHGYDYTVPDGRGYSPLAFPFAGPWLQPAFERMGYYNLKTNTELMEDLISQFNERLADIAGSPGFSHVHHVDLRGCLSNQLRKIEYQWCWDNEMHPTKRGFEIVSALFDAEIQTVFQRQGMDSPVS